MQNIKALIGVAIVGFMIYAGMNLLPPYFANYQFEDEIRSEARYASQSTRSEDDIRDAIMKKVRDHDLPITPEMVKVRRDGQEVIISSDYTVEVKLLGKPYILKFSPNTSSKK